MPRPKRNATRRHPPPQNAYDDAPDLLSFDDDAPPQTPYDAADPAVFELEPPPSDPELGRASSAIRDARLLDAPGFAKHAYAHALALDAAEEGAYGARGRLFAASESDIDDGGPASPSTSPPGPSSVGTGTFNFAFARADAPPSPPLPPAPAPGRSGISQLAAAEDTASDESSLGRSVGHIRAPVLAR